MAAAIKVAPFIYDSVIAVLQTSAAAAALQCDGSGTSNPAVVAGRQCGLSWSKGATWDGTSGVGQQMAALEVIQSNLIQFAKAPFTNSTGGTSQGDPGAGISDPSALNPSLTAPVTTQDRAGAGVLTALMIILMLGGLGWVSVPNGNPRQ